MTVDDTTPAELRSTLNPTQIRRRRDWRDGGRTVKRWDESLLAIALVVLGLTLLVAAAIRSFSAGAVAPIVANMVVLVGMLVAIVIAFLRAKPRPLLRWRAVDILYGLGAGLALRVVQGWLAVAAGEDGAFPSYSTARQRVGDPWLLGDIGSLLLFAPVIEELFFRGVLLVTAYSVVRRMAGRVPAMMVAVTLSTAAYVGAHAWTTGVSWEAWASPLIIGVVSAALVFVTGRIWGAVVLHFVMNVTFVALALIGTYWS
ncbi:CPBP family intramembrane glutamic endopeptidase [Microbacterium alcoholitolerans]|uniref:CPBP family intramembrane glutamic endopeptidase n=1 Tax=unclassified Microbacterium TaxID=2609290 RepID=UPI003D16B8BF